MQEKSAIERMQFVTASLHETWRKKPLNFLKSQQKELLLNYDMFETNYKGST